MSIEKFYNAAYASLINYGPRFLIGMLVLFVGLWLVKLILNRSHQGMHRKDVDPTLKPFLMGLIGVAVRILLVLGGDADHRHPNDPVHRFGGRFRCSGWPGAVRYLAELRQRDTYHAAQALRS